MLNYITVAEQVCAEISVKKSKFICLLTPVQSENDVAEILKYARQEWPAARHYCYACIIREQVLIERSSDDGEPAGTAGKPILDVIQRNSLQNIMVVVIRYFGGTLLGTGGLVKAYSGVVKECLDIAEIIEMELTQGLDIIIGYSYYGNIKKKCLTRANKIEDIIFTDKVNIRAYLSWDEVDSFIKTIINLTDGTAYIEKLNRCYLRKN